MFANHYAEAESRFRALLAASPGSAPAHAGHALLLCYERHFDAAMVESDAAVRLGPDDPLAAAVATRVKDWSTTSGDARSLGEAVQRGARAVKLAPRLVLAHAFYSEALADHGLAVGRADETAQAAAELDAATALGASDDYDRAEIERERANLAGDRHDSQGQLAHFLAARAAQPGWVERTKEIAGWYAGAGDEAQWKSETSHAIALDPDDADLRVGLGTLAADEEEGQLAASSFAAANRLRPHDAGIEMMLGATEFCLDRNAGAAESLLRAAFADAPTSVSVGLLLQGFLRYVKGDAAEAAAVTVGRDADPPRPGQKSSEQTLDQVHADAVNRALATINADRAKAHLAPVQLDSRISAGAESHAYWFLFNLCRPEVKGLGIHHEVAGTPGYSGYSMRDRASHFGFPPASMGEDITHNGTPEGAVGEWVDSVFHRFPIMRPDLTSVGYGEARLGDLPVEVLDLAFSTSPVDARSIVAFPADGQADVPTAFGGNELPDPVPKGGTYPTGYPVTVNFAPQSRVSISSYAISGPAGPPLPLYVLLPSPGGTENVLSMLPRSPLKSKTRYAVHVAGSIDGSPFSLDYAFTTA